MLFTLLIFYYTQKQQSAFVYNVYIIELSNLIKCYLI